mgnify:CR=1 FL=1
MRATVVTMTPEIAKDLLSKNIGNRKVRSTTLSFYKKQMLSGQWKENGEPIIIDTDGVIKDGQHRLMAVVDSNYSYRVPVIYGVKPDVMDTIDTGSNRSASDVLSLEGFKYTHLISSLGKSILNTRTVLSKSSQKSLQISNNDILKFANENKDKLYSVARKTMNEISPLQVVKVLAPSEIAYLLWRFGNNEDTVLFLKMITGTLRIPKTAPDYVYKKLVESKNVGSRMSRGDKQYYIERAYEKYKAGNPTIKSIKLKSNINKLNK